MSIFDAENQKFVIDSNYGSHRQSTRQLQQAQAFQARQDHKTLPQDEMSQSTRDFMAIEQSLSTFEKIAFSKTSE